MIPSSQTDNSFSFPPPPPLRGRTARLDFCTSQKSTLLREVGGTSLNESGGSIPPTPALPLKGGGRETRESWVGSIGLPIGALV
jgi:hypothetical protein